MATCTLGITMLCPQAGIPWYSPWMAAAKQKNWWCFNHFEYTFRPLFD
jgi:hypothetical protein